MGPVGPGDLQYVCSDTTKDIIGALCKAFAALSDLDIVCSTSQRSGLGNHVPVCYQQPVRRHNNALTTRMICARREQQSCEQNCKTSTHAIRPHTPPILRRSLRWR